MLSSSMPVPTEGLAILKTFRSASVYSFPVFGFGVSSTCASSLYVIAAAASTFRDRKRVMSNGWLTIVTALFEFGLIPFLLSAAKSSGWLPQHQTPTFFFAIFLIVLMPES